MLFRSLAELCLLHLSPVAVCMLRHRRVWVDVTTGQAARPVSVSTKGDYMSQPIKPLAAGTTAPEFKMKSTPDQKESLSGGRGQPGRTGEGGGGEEGGMKVGGASGEWGGTVVRGCCVVCGWGWANGVRAAERSLAGSRWTGRGAVCCIVGLR